MKKFLMIGALAFAATTVAETAMAAEFYVVRDATTKKCTVVDTKPTTTTTTVVDNGTYKTKTEAETGMKTMKVCTGVTTDPSRRKGRGVAAALFAWRSGKYHRRYRSASTSSAKAGVICRRLG